jgi:hypothetical protein
MPIICAIDGTEHENLDTLHKHLRKLKITQEVYYTEHAPVFDKGTGEKIPFKAPAAEYVKREFLNKNGLKKWLKTCPEEGKKWALDWLRKRKEEKGLVYSPTQVELRSLLCPSLAYYEAAFPEGYGAICKSLGYTPLFGGGLPESGAMPAKVIMDTREQKPLDLPVPTVSERLVCGDYGLPPDRDIGIYIERKNLSDFLGTLSDRETRAGDSNLSRFVRELERAQETGAYIIMLVEQPLSDALAYNSIPYLKRQFGHIRVTPEHIFHNLRDLLHRFPTSFQALFVKNRDESSMAVVKLLAAGDAVKSVDLQGEYDLKRLSFERPDPVSL